MAVSYPPMPEQQYPHTTATQDHGHQDHQTILDEARHRYGRSKPPFVRSPAMVKLGDTKQVVLATAEGRYPSRQDATVFATITARSFDDKHNYWSMDLNGEQIIVDMHACGPNSGYRQCLGIEGDSMTYTTYNVAFKVKSTAFDTAAENNASTEPADYGTLYARVKGQRHDRNSHVPENHVHAIQIQTPMRRIKELKISQVHLKEHAAHASHVKALIPTLARLWRSQIWCLKWINWR
ncbi:MAG: hypothetical protein Q9221_007152 [Calogaya cf. arnoldii]